MASASPLLHTSLAESYSSRLRRFAELSAGVLRNFHAELPQITERWGIDPTRVLERLAAEDEGALDRRLLRAFGLFRDRHTLPSLDDRAEVYRLPFALCSVEEAGVQRVLVETREPAEVPGWVSPGVEVTHWNGEPIVEAALRCGDQQRARHGAARLALGLVGLTRRTTGSVPKPRSEWVTLTGICDGSGGVREARFHWRASGLAALSRSDAHFSPACAAAVEAAEPLGSPDCSTLEIEGASVAVLRLRELAGEEAVRALDDLLRREPEALLVDLRGNAGGEIEIADRLVHRLVGGSPAPCRFQFRRTDAVRRMLRRHSAWKDWSEPESDGWFVARPVTSRQRLESRGSGYTGRVVVLVDALTYSAAEILAGRLREKAGAVLVGLDGATGGGLANAWGYSALASLHPTLQLELSGAERRRDGQGAVARDWHLARWAADLRLERAAGYSEADSGLWLLRREDGSEIAVEWAPERDDLRLAVFDRANPLLPELPVGLGLQLSVRRALVRGTKESSGGALVPDVRLRRRRLDVVRGDADLYRRCLRSPRLQRVAAPRHQRPPSGDQAGEMR
ncbi:MAG: S41 family peptidase [Acidobacteriota bacterium]